MDNHLTGTSVRRGVELPAEVRRELLQIRREVVSLGRKVETLLNLPPEQRAIRPRTE